MWQIGRGLDIYKNKGLSQLANQSMNYANNVLKQYGTPDREHLKVMSDQEDLIVAEIGVWRGGHAARLAHELDIREMFLIDPYDNYNDYDDGSNISKVETGEMKEARNEAHRRLEKIVDNINWIEKTSERAGKEIDKKLDYIYVDGNHSYQYVKEDLNEYYPKLKKEGIIAGDDINWDDVAKAFVEFTAENDLQPYFEPYHPEYYLIK